MLLWPSLLRADALFRSSGTSLSLDDGLDEALDEVLTLLETNDHGALARSHATHVSGKLTWARLAKLAVERLTPALLQGHEIERALLLGARLTQRDADKNARVTTETRDAILRLTHVASTLQAATALSEGREPTERRVYALLALHQRWWTLCRSQARRYEPAPILALVQSAAGAVLQSAAHASLKAIATKALLQWTPPPSMRSKWGDGPGETVEWDDEL